MRPLRRPSSRELTTPPPNALFPPVHRLRRLLTFALLALWLPATLHCDLEAAGLALPFVFHDHDIATGSDRPCADDDCHALDRASYTAFALTKLVSATVLSVLARLPESIETPVNGVRPERTDAPRELRRTWQFDTRAAPPARAPSALV